MIEGGDVQMKRQSITQRGQDMQQRQRVRTPRNTDDHTTGGRQ